LSDKLSHHHRFVRHRLNKHYPAHSFCQCETTGKMAKVGSQRNPGVLPSGTSNLPGLPSLRSVQPRPPRRVSAEQGSQAGWNHVNSLKRTRSPLALNPELLLDGGTTGLLTRHPSAKAGMRRCRRVDVPQWCDPKCKRRL